MTARPRPTRVAGTAAALALALVALAGCSDGGDDAPAAAPSESSTTPSEADAEAQVVEDFCTAAGLVAFLRSGEDLNLWARDMGSRQRPADLPADASAGLDLQVEYAAGVAPDAVAGELVQPDYTPEQVAQLEAYRTYLEGCPQVTDPPTPVPTTD